MKDSRDRTKHGGHPLAATFTNVGGHDMAYSDEIALEICAWIGDGGSLRSYCEKVPGAPSRQSVWRWRSEIPAFSALYEQARLDQADALADEIIDVADHTPDPAKARVMVDARKWVAARMRPGKYGDKIELRGDKTAPIALTTRDEMTGLSDTELLAIAAAGLPGRE